MPAAAAGPPKPDSNSIKDKEEVVDSLPNVNLVRLQREVGMKSIRQRTTEVTLLLNQLSGPFITLILTPSFQIVCASPFIIYFRTLYLHQ
jgi:hypothetical protein